MGALDRVLLAADLLEPDALGDAHEHLAKSCPWYKHVSEGGGDGPEKHCKPAKGGAAAGKVVKATVVTLTPRTPEASTVPEPTVPPGGPGLFHIKGRELPAYVQHLWHHLAAKYGKEKAYGMAVGIVKKWAAGVNPGGRHPTKTHPDVRAAAAKNVAQWEKDKADAHAQSREHDSKRVKATVALASPSATAPGAAPVGPAPGLYERPSQTTSPSPPLPPGAKLPTAAEIRKLLGQIPQCSDASLSQSARNHLDAAAVKLSKDDPLAALHVLRAAQSDIYAAHKADLGAAMPSAMTANVFTKVAPAERSSANTEMLRSKDQESRWRTLETAVATAIDRIRRQHFHGMYGGSPLARFSQEDGMSALDKVLLAAAGVPAVHDVSEPSATDTSMENKLLWAPDDLAIVDQDAAKELAALPPLDRLQINSRLDRAKAAMKAKNWLAVSQLLVEAKAAAHSAGAHDLARHIGQHMRAIAMGPEAPPDPAKLVEPHAKDNLQTGPSNGNARV